MPPNHQLQADRLQADQYQLSMDLAKASNPPSEHHWPPDMWEVLSVKYLHDPRRRTTLAVVGLMAGYEV